MLEAGTQVMRYVPTTGGFNVNYFEVTGGPTSAVTPGLPAAGYALHPCHPNPFNPATTISYDLPEPATVSLQVFDVSGRLVRTLVQGETVPSGRHEVVWNGQDETGRSVGSGIYFYRLEAGDFAATRRMSLVK
jgi:hypothetical protein